MPLNWNLRLPPSQVLLLMFLNQQAKGGVIVLAGVIQPDYLREIGPLLHKGSKEDYVWTQKISTVSLCITMLWLKINEKLQLTKKEQDSDPSHIKVWVGDLVRQRTNQLKSWIREGKGNRKSVIEGGVFKISTMVSWPAIKIKTVSILHIFFLAFSTCMHTHTDTTYTPTPPKGNW